MSDTEFPSARVAPSASRPANGAPSDLLDGPALVVRGPGEVVLEQRTPRSPGSGEVLVAPAHVGLCGTDLEIVRGDLDPAYLRYPVVLGHEWSGRVARVGPGVTGLAVGDPVVVEGIFSCSRCAACREGRTNMCLNYDELGFTIDGAAGPGVVAPEHVVHRLSVEVPLAAGALVEPAAVVLRGLTAISPSPGADVLVIGDGTVALLAAQLVRMWSPASVTMAGRRREQSELAAAAGVDEFTVASPAPVSHDIVVEAAGSTAAAESAFTAVSFGGRVLLLGMAGHGHAAKLYVDDVVNKDLSIRGSFGYTAAAWATTVRLLNSGRFRPLSLVTHSVELDRYIEALELLANPGTEARGKVLLTLPGSAVTAYGPRPEQIVTST